MTTTTGNLSDHASVLRILSRRASWRRLAFASAACAALGSAAVMVRPHPLSPPAANTLIAATAWPDFASTGPTDTNAKAGLAEREQRVLAESIAKRFRVARDAVVGVVATAYRAGAEHRVDPLLVLAVVAVESRFNPVAESPLGAMGLMQVLPKYHQEKLIEHGGDGALLDPVLNVEIGTRILREYLRGTVDIESGLQRYGGAAEEASAQYSGRVLSERARLSQVLARLRRSDA